MSSSNERRYRIDNPDDAKRVSGLLLALSNEKKWTVIIKPYRKIRSLNQNNLYWMWVTCIAEECGYDEPEEVHDVLRKKFLPKEIVEVLGERKMRLTSTASLEVPDFTEYLNKIERFAASELGLMLPRPEDLYHSAMMTRFQ